MIAPGTKFLNRSDERSSHDSVQGSRLYQAGIEWVHVQIANQNGSCVAGVIFRLADFWDQFPGPFRAIGKIEMDGGSQVGTNDVDAKVARNRQLVGHDPPTGPIRQEIGPDRVLPTWKTTSTGRNSSKCGYIERPTFHSTL